MAIWASRASPEIYPQWDQHATRLLESAVGQSVSGLAAWSFVGGALAWHFAVERRRKPAAPARLPGDGWLTLLVVLVGALAAAPWPFPSVIQDTSASTYATQPAAAAANAVIAIGLAACVAVIGLLALTRRAERRDEIRSSWRRLDREWTSAV